jgi:hypothetical protein
MNFLYKWLPRIYGIGAIIWVLTYWIWKYTRVEVVEETQTTMAIIPLMIIGTLLLVVGIGSAVVAALSWWDTVKSDKLSFKTFLPFYLLIATIMIIALLGLNKMNVLIELNVDQFLNDLQGYTTTARNSLFILGSGLIIGGGGLTYEYILSNQQTP